MEVLVVDVVTEVVATYEVLVETYVVVVYWTSVTVDVVVRNVEVDSRLSVSVRIVVELAVISYWFAVVCALSGVISAAAGMYSEVVDEDVNLIVFALVICGTVVVVTYWSG